ncbi:hypothetical protein Tco_0700153 [Tanacetum coccineum]
MEEYIRLEEEKACRRGKVYNWETTTYGKIWYDDDIHDLKSVETEFPTIVFNDELTSEKSLPCEPMPTISYSDDLDFLKDFENEFLAIVYNDALTSKLDSSAKPVEIPHHMTPLPHRDQRHPWLGYQVEGYTKDIIHNYEQRLETIFYRSVNRVHILDFGGLTEGMRQTLAGRLRMVYTGGDRHELFTTTLAPGLERQLDAATSARKATRDAPAVDEGAPADPAPMQAPQPPHVSPRTMP